VPEAGRSLIDLDTPFLPLAQMRQISRVTEIDGSAISAEVDLGREHWVYAQHFPGDPVFPGSLMIEAAGQLVALWAWAQGQRGRPRLVRTSASFHSPVAPAHERLLLHAQVRRKQHLNFATIDIWAAGTQVATLETVLAVVPAAA